MNKSLKLRLGKTDQLIKNWWVKLAENNINISDSINQCITYYVKTGEFLEIARIPIVLKEFDTEVKKVYLPENSVAYIWLMERQAQGDKYSTIIKRVLRNSIKETVGECYLMPSDELSVTVEQVGMIRMAQPTTTTVVQPPSKILESVPRIQNVPTQNSSTSIPVEKTEKTPDKQEKPTISKSEQGTKQNQWKTEETTQTSGKDEHISEYDRLFNRRNDEEEEEEDVFDLYSLLGHSLNLENDE